MATRLISRRKLKQPSSMAGRSIYPTARRASAISTGRNIGGNNDAMAKQNRKPSGPAAGNRPGEKRSSGKKPSGTNVSRGGGSAAANLHNERGKPKAKTKRGWQGHRAAMS